MQYIYKQIEFHCDLTVGPAHQEKLKLEEQRRAAEEKYKYKKRQIPELQEDIDVNTPPGREFIYNHCGASAYQIL